MKLLVGRAMERVMGWCREGLLGGGGVVGGAVRCGFGGVGNVGEEGEVVGVWTLEVAEWRWN
jgi:hypothetical protein